MVSLLLIPALHLSFPSPVRSSLYHRPSRTPLIFSRVCVAVLWICILFYSDPDQNLGKFGSRQKNKS